MRFTQVLYYCSGHRVSAPGNIFPLFGLNKNVTSVSWRTKQLDATMLGHQVVFYPPDGLELMKDQIDFATQRLN